MNMRIALLAVSIFVIATPIFLAGVAFKEPVVQAYENVTLAFAPVPLSPSELEHQKHVKKCNDDALFLRGHRDLYEDNRIKNCTVTGHTVTGEEKVYSLIAEWDAVYGKKAPTPPPLKLKAGASNTQGKP
jgi:hypothetical protein